MQRPNLVIISYAFVLYAQVVTSLNLVMTSLDSSLSRRESSRLLEASSRRVLDSATRQRRLNKQLEALEKDNFQVWYIAYMSLMLHIKSSFC